MMKNQSFTNSKWCPDAISVIAFFAIYQSVRSDSSQLNWAAVELRRFGRYEQGLHLTVNRRPFNYLLALLCLQSL